jgi:hypothetical protein
MMVYPIVLASHNVMRWVVVLSAIIALFAAYRGWLKRLEWTRPNQLIGMVFTSSLDVQLLLGLLLYFVFSPITRTGLQNLSAVMMNPDLRFFVLEHFGLMLVAVICAHLGSILSKKAEPSGRKHRLAAIWFTLSLILIFLGIPWTRPLLPALL